ncbi:MAG: hypothetical protein Q4F31_07525 [Eubacteriales bacterium]|nr:hypothetical protein [Eubacteriales bacterium]
MYKYSAEQNSFFTVLGCEAASPCASLFVMIISGIAAAMSVLLILAGSLSVALRVSLSVAVIILVIISAELIIRIVRIKESFQT